MHPAIKDGISLGKLLLRNGHDAHVINIPLQASLIEGKTPVTVDIACDASLDELKRLLPAVCASSDSRIIGQLDENGVTFRFYPMQSGVAGHPELSLLRLTPGMLEGMPPEMRVQMRVTGFGSPQPDGDTYDGFADLADGAIRFLGLPDETLRHDYLLGIRALRFAANFDMPIEPNTWMAIVRSAVRIVEYVPVTEIMAEWRKVSAEAMASFVRLLYDSHILQGLIPELASLACVAQQNDKSDDSSNVFEHTLRCVELYPQGGMHYDWLGTMAMLFHDVGKLYTAEYYEGRWTYYQHHTVGASITRKILHRLHFDQEDIELICLLVGHHMRFHFMMTDRAIRRFRALGETSRLIAMARADLLSKDDSFTAFNHNMKYLNRAETPEQLLEPLLNGNEIMAEIRLTPGPLVGNIRQALLDAQKKGEVTSRDDAVAFVRAFAAGGVGS